MANDYYTHGGAPTQGSTGSSAVIRAEFDLLVAAFDKLPALSANANKAVVVNSGGTGLTVTTGTLALAGNLATTGAFNTTFAQVATTTLNLPAVSGLTIATITGTEELTNKTLTAAVAKGVWTASGTWTLPALTLGGTVSGGGNNVNNVIIGAVSPLAGSFTTLSGSGDFAIATNKFTVAAASGNTLVAGTLSSTGDFAVNTNKFNVTASSGNTAIAGTLGVTGDVAINTNKFNITASSGATAIAGTLSPAGLVDISGASAGQVKFPATQNASANANTLDDYEEGTWTPSVGGSATYTTQTGYYTKVGNAVNLWMNLLINAIGTGSTYQVSGCPFTPAINSYGAGYWTFMNSNFITMFSELDTSAVLTIYGMSSAQNTAEAAVGALRSAAGFKTSTTFRV